MTAEQTSVPEARTTRRIDMIDVFRGVALVAMAIYHFAWDLEFFGYAEPGMTAQGGWKIFARSIASSFLFLAGVSLLLAHGKKIRWRGFFRRFVQLTAAAALITLVTFYATPERYVFFGILHQIAFASLFGLIFLRLPVWLTILVAAFIFYLGFSFRSDWFSHPTLWFLGLTPISLQSNDFVPVFPWTAATLAGIAASRLALKFGVFDYLAGFRAGYWVHPIRFCGRHGLVFYLVHQPVLVGLVWLFAQFWPASAETPEHGFMRACEQSCVSGGSGINCPGYCACVLDSIDAEGRLDDMLAGVSDDDLKTRLGEIAGQCRSTAEQ